MKNFILDTYLFLDGMWAGDSSMDSKNFLQIKMENIKFYKNELLSLNFFFFIIFIIFFFTKINRWKLNVFYGKPIYFNKKYNHIEK